MLAAIRTVRRIESGAVCHGTSATCGISVAASCRLAAPYSLPVAGTGRQSGRVACCSHGAWAERPRGPHRQSRHHAAL